MLYISLVVSSLMLLITVGLSRVSQHPVRPTGCVCALLGFGTMFIGLGLPPAMLLSLALFTIMSVCAATGRVKKWFIPLACLSTGAVYAICSFVAWQQLITLQELRVQYGFESIKRLPLVEVKNDSGPLDENTLSQLERMESGADVGSFRRWGLRRLHQETVGLFINSSGFGVARIMRPDERMLQSGLREGLALPQPSARQDVFISPGELFDPSTVDLAEQFENLHRWNYVDFVNPAGFGYVRDREHVAGFQAHQFGHHPRDDEEWAIQTIDLMGLIMHEDPVVYISDHLPNMEELADAPTRPLDMFEAAGLQKLRNGKMLFIRSTEGHTRMIGAIRSAKQCIDCHGGERGELLGAFSYTFRKATHAGESAISSSE